MNKNAKNRINVILFLLPALILFVSIIILPIFYTGYFSFTDRKEMSAEGHLLGSKKKHTSYRAPGVKVLVAEGDYDAQAKLEEIFRNTRIKPDFVENGTSLVKKASAIAYDCILVDVSSLGSDALGSIEKLKALGSDENACKDATMIAYDLDGSANEDTYLNGGYDLFAAEALDGSDLDDCMLKAIPEDKIEKISIIDNYISIFKEEYAIFGTAIKNALILAVLSVFIQLPLALGLALVLGKGIKGERGFLSIYFFPVLISTVIIGKLWMYILYAGNASDFTDGLLNTLLRGIGIIKSDNGIPWLSKTYGLGSVFVATLWQYVGYHMLLLYAGVKSVPIDMREAAMLDGASEGQVNRFIVIPYMKPVIKVSVIFAITGSLKSYDLFTVMLNDVVRNVPVPTTKMVEFMLNDRYAQACAMSVILIALCFVFALIVDLCFGKED